MKKEKYEVLLRNQVLPQPGLFELIDKLITDKYLLGLASASNTNEIEIVLDRLGLKDKITVFTSVEECEKGKPAPDVYLATAQKLNVKPH